VAGLAGTTGSADATGSDARFNAPSDVAADSAGNLYVSDSLNHTVRRISPAGIVTTVAGLAGTSGNADGSGSAARFFAPEGLAIDSAGNLYVADTNNHTIRKITSSGTVTTLAGLPGTSGSSDGSGSGARFFHPADVTVDLSGSLFVIDTDNHTIRNLSATGVVGTVAGHAGQSGSTDGTGSAARFYYPTGIAADASGNLYIADTNNHVIRKAEPQSVPVIQINPQGQTANAGATVSFTVVATGAPAPTYRWYFDGTVISGATEATLTMNNVQASDTGSYSVTVSNTLGSVTSPGVLLTVNTVNPPPASGGGGGGGGGGAPGLWFLGTLILLVAARRIFG
jgi:sugar lactone lactonase YvrE